MRTPSSFSKDVISVGLEEMKVDLACYEAGISEGTVVLFLHGLAGNHETFREGPEELAGEDVRIIVPDLPGHGDSPDRNEYPYNPFWYRNVVQGLLTARSVVPDVVVGHSMGGTIGLLVCEEISASLICLEGIPERLEFLERRLNRHGDDNLNEGYRRMREELGGASDPGLQTWVQWAEKTVPRTFFESARRFVSFWQQHDMIERYCALDPDSRHYIAGEDGESTWVQQRLSPEEYTIIPNAGHFMMVDQPDRFWKEIRSLIF